MVPRQAFINRIRSLGCAFKGQQRRTYLYRLKNGLVFIPVPKADLLEDDWVRSQLRRLSLNEEEIARFIGEARS